MRKVVTIIAVLCASIAPMTAQQITRFGVVDTAKVYQAYYRNSAAVRSYEKKKDEAQEEITRRTEALRDLRAKRDIAAQQRTDNGIGDGDKDYGADGDEGGAGDGKDTLAALDKEIAQKTQALNDFAAAKNAELQTLRRSLQGSDAFYKKLYAVIGRVAETGGYCAVLSLQESSGVLWYSPSVDITDEVIKALEK